MSAYEIVKIVGIAIAVLSTIAALVAKFTTHGNKIKHIEGDQKDTNKKVETLEKKHDRLEDSFNEIKTDIKLIKEMSAERNNYMYKLLTRHDDAIRKLELKDAANNG